MLHNLHQKLSQLLLSHSHNLLVPSNNSKRLKHKLLLLDHKHRHLVLKTSLQKVLLKGLKLLRL